jgi:hypothetical protein
MVGSHACGVALVHWKPDTLSPGLKIMHSPGSSSSSFLGCPPQLTFGIFLYALAIISINHCQVIGLVEEGCSFFFEVSYGSLFSLERTCLSLGSSGEHMEAHLLCINFFFVGFICF